MSRQDQLHIARPRKIEAKYKSGLLLKNKKISRQRQQSTQPVGGLSEGRAWGKGTGHTPVNPALCLRPLSYLEEPVCEPKAVGLQTDE